MKISEIINKTDGSILSDGQFTSLGLAVSKCEEKLMTFVEDYKYILSLPQNITCVITTEDIGNKIKNDYGVIVSNNPRLTYFKLHNNLAAEENYCRHNYKTVIGDNANISSMAIVSKTNVTIGNNVTIEEFCIIRDNVEIRDHSIIRAGSIIGGEGFEFKRTNDAIINVKHCGGVIIDKNVEVQYNTTIDKALYTWDNTIIGKYTKLDNGVHIEHAVKIGERNLIASKVIVGGRTIIGSDCWIGLGAIISNGLIVEDNAKISLGAVVTKNISESNQVSGNFAIDHKKYLSFIKNIR